MSIIDKAFKLATEAQNLESKKEYRDAASRYMESVRLFLAAIPKMKDERSSTLIRGKVKMILDRAEECKRRDIPEAPKEEGEEDEEEKNDVDESTFEARLKKLKKKKSEEEEEEEELTEASIMERFDRYRGLDPKKAQAQREAEAIQRRRWLAGIGGPPKKLIEEEQRAKLLGRMRDEVRLSEKDKKDVENDDDDVDPMSVLDTDSMNFDLIDDDESESTNRSKDAGKQDKLTLDAKDLISQARAEISKEKNKGEDEGVDLPTLDDLNGGDSHDSEKKHDTLLALFEKKIITKEQYVV